MRGRRSRSSASVPHRDVGRSAGDAVPVYISRLRKELRAVRGAEVGVNRRSGYALAVPPEAVDAYRFERLLADAHASASDGRRNESADALRRALALWRGAALELEAP